MKKLFSALLSVLTSAAITAGAAVPYCSTAADEEETVYVSGIVNLDSTEYLTYFSEDTHIFGAHLDENNLAVYKAMMNLLNPSLDVITVQLPEPVTISVSSTNQANMTEADQVAYEEAVMQVCRTGIDAVLFDMPEIFWLDLANMGVGTQSTTSYNWSTRKYSMTIRTVSFSPAYYSSFSSMNEVMEYKDKLENAVENFTVTGETRYEQLKSIHDTISLFTYYDGTSRFTSSPLGSLVEPGAVCEAYAEGFKLICDKLEIPCALVVGNFSEDGLEAHMWNYVKMEDGKWYAVDVTWDDRDGKYGVKVAYDFFLKGSVTMSKDHTPETQFGYSNLTYPELSAEDYDPTKPIVTTTTTVAETTTTTTTTAAPATTTTTSTRRPRRTTTTTTSSTTTSTTTTTTTSSTSTTTTSTTTTATETTTETTSTTQSTTAPPPETTTGITYTSPVSTTTSATTTLPETTTTAIIYTTPVDTTTTPPAETETTTTEAQPVEGDVNGDGRFNIADLVYCAGAVLGNIQPEQPCDADGDGILDGFDITFIRQLLLEILL